MTKTVVMMDDDKDMIAYVRQVLEGAGLRVMSADNGKDGIELALRVRPDLVLLDVLIPVVQGYDVCRYLKSRAELAGTKVVFLTSLTRALDRGLAEGTGADGYLTKPIGVQQLLYMVREVLAVPA
jgi:DNA-binding response OmpR family regulator